MMRTVPNSRRSRTGCSILALATVLAVGPTPASAGSFASTSWTVTHGGAIINNPALGTTTSVSVTTPSAVIEWIPTDNITNNNVPINFQPAGTTATFSGAGDYAVLNKVMVSDFSRVVELRGTIQTVSIGAVTGTGSIYFYSPSGFLLAGSSVVNVGSAVFSALPITIDGNGNFITGADRTVTFGAAENPTASITTDPDAQITATGLGNSYVAMVAPRVVHNGAISVDGSAALVAAEAATISFSPDGLFDIQVTTGTTDSEGLNVHGTVGGPTPTGSEDTQGIYLVAVPKNQLMTMVIGNGADLGFTLANTAVDDNGTIVLSAGHDIVGGEIAAKSAGHGTGSGNLWFTGARARNNLFAEATGYADLYSIADQPTTIFDNDVTVHAVESVSMGASGVETSLTVGGNLSLSTNVTGAAGESVLAGNVSLYAADSGIVSIAGATTLSANATGGNASVGTAGSGAGGTITVSEDDGGSLTLLSLTGTAFGTGGNGTADGANAGHGTGGVLNMYAHNTGSVVVNGAVSLDAKGTGGSASGAGLAGNGLGGGAYAYIGDNAAITINGATTLKSDGQGGAHATGNGGSGTGGASRITSVQDSTAGGLLTFNGNVELSSDGTGGASDGGGTGGTGTGGWARISTPDDHDVDVNGNANLRANGTGGASETGNGGFGDGGRAELESYVGGIDISGSTTLTALGLGGSSIAAGTTAGDGLGGDIKIVANPGSSILLQGFVDGRAIGQGGYTDFGVNGGDGTGGTIDVSAAGTGAVITFAEGLNLFADGLGSLIDSDCTICNLAAGGNGQGGSVTFTGGSGGTINATGDLELNQMELSATGSGGRGGSGVAGNGTGGMVLVSAPTGVTMTFNGELQLNASGDGGFSEGANAAGNGTGNSAGVHVDGGSVTVTGELKLDADGSGGESQGGGDGGDGTGGRAIIRTSGSTAQLNVTGDVLLEADGIGGESYNIFEGPRGNGGDGFGGRTRAVANDGLIHITGNLDMDATSTGGDGANGGNAVGVTTPSNNEGAEPAAFLWAGAETAELRVGGLTDIDVSATGGTGFNGNGGLASGGEIDIVSDRGFLNFANVTGTTDAEGGGGSNGGAGGNATAGDIDVAWSIAPSGPLDGRISMATVNLSATGRGGNGGTGINGDSGGNGGNGGNGAGGSIFLMGTATGATLTTGAATLVAEGHGGDGGDGGSGDGGPGGNGGAGGSGSAALIQTGTFNFGGNSGSGGSTTYGALSQSASATGGNGGNGGNGGGGMGAGGNGGNVAGGLSVLTARGVIVTASSVSLLANATGGNGGSGSTAGNGGNAVAGNVGVEVKDRTDHPTQRGTLNVIGSLTGTAIAQGGTGAAAGTATVPGNSFFRLINGDANIGSVSFNTAGNLYNGALGPDYIQVQDGTGTIGSFSYYTTGQLAIYTTSTGALNVGTLSLSAGNFIDHPTLVGPASPGTISATSLSVTSGGDFFADANLNVTNGIGITVPGSIRFDNATSAAFVDLWAQGGSISLDDISAGDIELEAAGNISFANANAGTEIDFDSESGSVAGGNIVSGNQISGSAGGNVVLQNLTVSGAPQEGEDFSVGISAIGNISVGNVTAPGPVGFATQGNLLTGTINAGDLFMALVGGNASTAGITTSGEGGGQVYIGDDSMFLTGGGTWDGDGDFIVSTVLDLDPVRTGGSIAINGPIITGLFQAAAGTSLTTGAITSGAGIGLDANLAITTGNLVAGDFVLANGGSITTGSIDADSVDMASTGGNITIGGNVSANGLVELGAFGNIVTDDITAGTIELRAGGSITTDNLTTELPLLLAADFQGMPQVDPEGEGNIVLIAGGNILTGDITAAESILLVTQGTITGQTIEAGNIFMALGHGDMSFGDATAVEVFLADFAMFSEGGGEVGDPCVGSCGTLGADGDVTAPPSGPTYLYVTTDGGVALGEQIPIEGDNDSTNGSHYTTSVFTAAAGDDLEFWFNYVTSDGGGFADYAWASLLTANLDPVAILFTARTQASGTIVPGFGLPDVEATLTPAAVPIISDGPDDGPDWSALGSDTGACFDAGCGYTGWVNSTYEITEAGNYVVRFGVSNWTDTGYDSGMAFSGITIGGVPVETALTPTGGSITIGNVNTGKMTAAAGTTLTAGIIDASDFVDLHSGGNMITSTITAVTDLFADAGGTMSLGAVSAGDIELNSVGNMSFVSADADTEFDFSSGGSVSGGNVTAGAHITGDAAGTATLNGIWNADSVTLSSNDINIAASGGINANGTVTLVSTNTTQAVIGDGPAGGNYALSNAEFGRVSGENVVIVGRDTSAFVDMVIGDLTVTGPLAGSTIEGEGGALVFAVGDLDTETASGIIRVVGDVNATGFGIDNAVEFYADRFELDAATGSLSVPGGEIGLYADRIHVAQGSILNQLAANPTYAGYQEDLNEAAATPRPGGVLIADTLWIESDNLQSILIQNTGTFQTRAGFLVRQAFVNEDFEVAGPAGSINLVVNGQVLSGGGTLTGVAARDALIDEETDITPFTSNSTINGCPLTGVCIIQPQQPPPTADVVDDQIDLITGNPLGDGEFGNEDSIDDNEEGDDGANNPISPPQPLFDTRPLIPGGDVNDPVSGTGNPALLGSDSDCEQDEDGQCAAGQTNGDGQ
jgi:hypothetical protein